MTMDTQISAVCVQRAQGRAHFAATLMHPLDTACRSVWAWSQVLIRVLLTYSLDLHRCVSAECHIRTTIMPSTAAVSTDSLAGTPLSSRAATLTVPDTGRVFLNGAGRCPSSPPRRCPGRCPSSSALPPSRLVACSSPWRPHPRPSRIRTPCWIKWWWSCTF